MTKPNYQNGSIVNLMSSILQGLGQATNHHSALSELNNKLFTQARNIVLLVIDGLGYNYLTKKAPHNYLHQNLHGKLTSVFPSTTATSITTFLTGLAPQQHGLTGWFTYFQELQTILTVLPVQPRYSKVPLENFNIDVASLYGHVPIFNLLDVESYMVSPQYIAYSDYSLAHRGNATIKPYNDLNDCFASTRDIIKHNKHKKYIYTYWPQFDSMAHEKGVASEHVANHFKQIDEGFGQFIDDIKGTNTLVIVTADHGFIDAGANVCIELEHHPHLQAMLSMPLSGEPRMAYCYVNNNQHGEFESYLENNLAEQITVHPSRNFLEQNFFGLGPAHPQLHRRIGDYMLEMQHNYTIMDTLADESRFYQIGTHGGLSEDEMLVPLVVVET